MWRMRKSIKRKWIIGAVFCVLQCVGVVGCYMIIKYTTIRKYTTLLEEKERIVQQAKRTVYITSTCVKAGEVFTEENTEKKTILSEQNPGELETEILGKIACADLPEGSIVSKMLCCMAEVHASERECVLRDVKNAECFADGTVVELRIRYDNGENYCVIKRKRLRKGEEEFCRFYLTEEEQLVLSAAQYDVQIYDGAELYLVGFREERVQSDACNEYLPPVQIIMQLSDLNEKYDKISEQLNKQRTELEERLTEYKRKKRDGLL